MNIKRHIPNAITCLNLLSGALSIIYTLKVGDLHMAATFIILAAVFDFFDGLAARALGVSSPIGKDLDSLADVLSFGLAPAILVVQGLWDTGIGFYEALPVLVLAAAAALRLAKFNHDTRQTTSFIGLPVPANALFWIGYWAFIPTLADLIGGVGMRVSTYVGVVLLAYLMLSEIPMFSFKVKKLSFSALAYQIILVVAVVASVVAFGLLGFSIGVLAYVLLSIVQGSTKA
ncbi:MAG: CDP-diacylglycerol--serine O-phosphatidyltransferase [Porphyromonadaceae bacterium]|nr:CDP-diacylglycerol--serine O-phosphatidyltransferase [Porphyromonadaceae bacterium]